MAKDLFTFLVGGKAGGGVKSAVQLASAALSSIGRYIFQNDDYPNLIRGGHSYSVVTSSATRKVMSHYVTVDLLVSLDQKSHDLHQSKLAEGGLSVVNSDAVEKYDHTRAIGIPMTAEAKKYPNSELRLGVGATAVFASAVGIPYEALMATLEQALSKDMETNRRYTKTIFAMSEQAGIANRLAIEGGGTMRGPSLTGNEAIALGAAAAGLDMYIAYPMTPASSILHFLAANEKDLGLVVFHPESELAVANIAVGAAAAGARVAVGTSAGGFALMEEAYSLAGMVESPLLCILSMRPGPSTGVPTYTSQGDLMFALHQGHGEFPRIVASPGTVEEAFYLAAEMLELVWRFQTPGILLTDKHLSEASITVEVDPQRITWSEPLRHDVAKGKYKRYLNTPDGVSPLLFPPTRELIKWNSYEHDETGISAEKADIIVKMHEKRLRKEGTLIKHMRDVKTVNVYGRGDVTIFTYGSTTMSVLEALHIGGIDAKVVQPIYLRPLPVWELAQHRTDTAIVVESSATGQFATLLHEKVGISGIRSIKQYDGRPFEPTELAMTIKGLI